VKRLASFLPLVLLALARAAAACPLCADSNSGGGAGTGIWTAVGAFLVVPPILGVVVIGAMKKERAAARQDGVPEGLTRITDRES
jgi:hypothetical protein